MEMTPDLPTIEMLDRTLVIAQDLLALLDAVGERLAAAEAVAEYAYHQPDCPAFHSVDACTCNVLEVNARWRALC